LTSILIKSRGAESDGEEAIAKCKERHPDIAFVDIQMLKMDGLEVLGQIRAMSRKTAVVMLTAYGTLNQVVDAMKRGARTLSQERDAT